MSTSSELFQLTQQYIPGGVNSPVRAFKSVGGEPIFFKAGEGAYLIDVDNRKYIDYVGSWGALILGHAPSAVIEAITDAIQKGLSFGAPTMLEMQLAQKICAFMPSIERIRMVNSGTEATMSAIRLARGFTGRNKILKFAGCYHGHADSLLVEAGSGVLTLGIPSSAGVPESVAQDTLVAEYNRLDTVEALFNRYGEDIAAIIVEPVAGNMNCVLPRPDFLSGLRSLCDAYQSLLIFDEVMTGFRVALGGAQAVYGVKPDLTTLGKVIGGGLPVGAFGGRADIMDCIAPKGAVYQAGTLSGNPITMTAGLVTLDLISKPNFFENLAQITRKFTQGLQACANEQGIPFHTVSAGGMFGIFFNELNIIETYDDVKKSNIIRFKQFFHAMLQEGIYFAPSAFEAGFVSSAHGEAEIAKTFDVAKKVFTKLM